MSNINDKVEETNSLEDLVHELGQKVYDITRLHERTKKLRQALRTQERYRELLEEVDRRVKSERK